MDVWKPRSQQGQRHWSRKALHAFEVGWWQVGGREAEEGVDAAVGQSWWALGAMFNELWVFPGHLLCARRVLGPGDTKISHSLGSSE